MNSDDLWFIRSWNAIQDHVAAREDISFAERNTPENYNVPEKLCLVHSELSEALEGYRKDLMDTHLSLRPSIEVELADAVIRIMGIAKHLDLDIPGAILDKAAYNDTRLDHTPAIRRAAGGKRF